MGNTNSGFVTYNDLDKYLSKYARKTDLENTDLSGYAKTSDLKKNTIWCAADGNLCEVPKNIRSLNIQNPGGKITQFGGTGENYIYGRTTIDNLYSINGMDLATFKSSLIGPEGKQGPSGKDGKDGKDGGLTFDQIQNNNFSKLQTDTLNANLIGDRDASKFVSGWGGFHTGFQDSNGRFDGNNANKFTRGGLDINNGYIKINPSNPDGQLCIKDWCISQNGNGNLVFKKTGNSGVYELDKTNDSRWVGWTSNSSNTSYGGVYGGVGARV